MKKILLIVILFCSYLSTLAHVGQHQNNQMSSKTWYFQDKTKATEGYFLFTKDNQAVLLALENGNHHIITKYDIIGSIK